MKVRYFLLLFLFVLNPFFLSLADSISGVVIDAGTSNPISGILVTAATRDWSDAYFGQTQADGTYTISNISAGEYFVQIDTQGTAFSDYISEWYDNAYSFWEATPVDVTQPNNTPNIDFLLDAGGYITGQVNDESNAPLSNISLGAYDYKSGEYISGATTIADGTYQIKRLFSGNYRVCARPTLSNYIPECYDGVFSKQDSTSVNVTQPNTTSSINFILSRGGTIAGNVRDKDTGVAIYDCRVVAYDANTGEEVNYAYPDSNGMYNIIGLYTGDYIVCVELWEGTEYIPQCYDNVPVRSQATPVSITAPNTHNIWFRLQKERSPQFFISNAC